MQVPTTARPPSFPQVSSSDALSDQHDARRRRDELVARVCARITRPDGAAAAAWAEFVASLQVSLVNCH
jgi:hypothetical protein